MVTSALCVKFARPQSLHASPSKSSVALLEETIGEVARRRRSRPMPCAERLAKALLSTGATERGREVLRKAVCMDAGLNDRPPAC